MSEEEEIVSSISLDRVSAECFITKSQFSQDYNVPIARFGTLKTDFPLLRIDEIYGERVDRALLNSGFLRVSLTSSPFPSHIDPQWLIGALAIIAKNNNIVSELVPSYDIRLGFYTVVFHPFGKQEKIVIDDKLYVDPATKQQIICKSENLDCVLPDIVLKAYAAMVGGYEHISGGSLASALVDLTGGTVDTYALREGYDVELWSILQSALADPDVMLGVSAKGSRSDNDGILANHAYPVEAIFAVGDGRKKIVKLRNPWTQATWQNEWSREDRSVWTEQTLREVNTDWEDIANGNVFFMNLSDFIRIFSKVYFLKLYKALQEPPAKPVGANVDDAEEEIEDPAEEEAEEDEGKPRDKRRKPIVKAVISRWNTALSGGSIAFAAEEVERLNAAQMLARQAQGGAPVPTGDEDDDENNAEKLEQQEQEEEDKKNRAREGWLNNPQFRLATRKPNTTITIALQQEDIRHRGEFDFPCSIGLYVLRNSQEDENASYTPVPPGSRRDPNPENPNFNHVNELIFAQTEAWANSRDVSLTITIEQPGEFIILPTTYEPRGRTKFLLRVCSHGAFTPFDFEPLDEANVVPIETYNRNERPPLEDLIPKLKAREEKFVDRDFPANNMALYNTLRYPSGRFAHVAQWRRPKEILTPPPPPPPTEEEIRAKELKKLEEQRERERREEEEKKKKKKKRRGDSDDDDDEDDRKKKKKGGKTKGKKGRDDSDDESGDENASENSDDRLAPIVVPDPLMFPVESEEAVDDDDKPQKGGKFGNIVQGDVDDCYLIGALGSLTTRAESLKSLIVSSDFETGVHEVRFFTYGQWTTVIVDDLLPCNADGMPVFAHSNTLNEFWPAIIEKAYAKLNKGYINIEGGTISYVLNELTGNMVDTIDLAAPELQAEIESGDLWEKLLGFKTKNQFMSVTSQLDTPDPFAASEDGIIKNHAYGILDIRESLGNTLVRLRNPWGVKEWTGPFADGSKDWSKKILKDLEYSFDNNDGSFWMPFENFVKEFNLLYVTREFNEEPDEEGQVWLKKEFTGKWDFKYSGGGVHYEDTFMRNPQYHMTVTEPNTTVFIQMQVPDARSYALEAYPEGINFFVIKNIKRHLDPEEEEANPDYEVPEVKRREKITGMDDIVGHAQWVRGRSVSAEVVLNPGQDYILLPATYDRGVQHDYKFTIFSRNEVEIEPLKGDKNPVLPIVEKRKIVSQVGKWTLKKAGGCPNNDTWNQNPQYLLRFDKDTQVSIYLTQLAAQGEGKPLPENSIDLHSIGFVVLRSRRPEKVPVFKKENLRGYCEFKSEPLVNVDLELKAGENYVVVPSTYEAGRLGKFELKILTHDNATLERIDKEDLVDTTSIGPRRANFALDDVKFRTQNLGDIIEKPLQRTLVILKPDAISLGSAEIILSMIEDQPGMTIVQQSLVELNMEQMREFAPSESDAVISFMASGPILALVVMGPGVVEEFQLLAGDADPTRAQLDMNSPATIRAMFGTDAIRNAVYCSESEQGARRDIKFFFPDMIIEPLPEIIETKKFLAQSIYPALIEGLTELCKTKPEDPMLWLGQWLVDNNPTKPHVEDKIQKQEYTVEEPDH